jgi:pimeloyl-ACP methyl ester carboxylesterase
MVSEDPTPTNPIALKFMLQANDKCSIYLARPFQYIGSDYRDPKFWTSDRFSQKIIESMNDGLDIIKNQDHNTNFNLIGHSGGGAIALLLGASRNDVTHITTYGGTLDTVAWTNIHHLTPLSGSLNPADYAEKLQYIKQLHIIGKKDFIMPIGVFYGYLNKFTNKKNISYRLIDTDHSF